MHLVSVMDAEARLCEEWFERELKPLLEHHREQATASLKRKVGGLREAVLNTLKARLHGRAAGVMAASGEQVAKAITLLRKSDALVQAAESEAANLVDEVPDLTDALLTAAASEIATIWRQRHPPTGESAALCAAALGLAVGRHTAKLVERVESLRRELEQALTEARRVVVAVVTGTEPLPRPSGVPMFDPTELTPKLELRPSRLLRRLGMDLLRRWARSQLQRQTGDALGQLLSGYRRRLSLWLSQTLAELRAAFHAQAGPLRAQLEARASASVGESSAASLEADLRRLQEGRYDAG